MAYSYNRYISNGVTTTFTSPPYLEAEHISVEVQGVTLETSAYTLTGTIVNLLTPPLVSQEVIVRRSTSPSTRLVTFTSTYLDEDDLNRNADQLLYLMQEALDAQVGVAEYLDNITTTEKLAAKALTGGQTVVVFAETLGAEPYFRINGESVDNTLLSEGTDYTLDLPNRTVTLSESYPAGTVLSAYGLFTALGGEDFNTTQVAQNVIDIAQNAVDIDALEAKAAVSVKDFGAVGDGVTDDTAAIEAAWAASNSISFPAGTYYAPVLEIDGGGGYDAKVIKGNGATITGDDVFIYNLFQTSITDLKITASGSIYLEGIRYNSFRNVYFDGNVKIGRFNETLGLSSWSMYWSDFRQCRFSGGVTSKTSITNANLNSVTFDTCEFRKGSQTSMWEFDDTVNADPTFSGVTFTGCDFSYAPVFDLQVDFTTFFAATIVGGYLDSGSTWYNTGSFKASALNIIGVRNPGSTPIDSEVTADLRITTGGGKTQTSLPVSAVSYFDVTTKRTTIDAFFRTSTSKPLPHDGVYSVSFHLTPIAGAVVSISVENITAGGGAEILNLVQSGYGSYTFEASAGDVIEFVTDGDGAANITIDFLYLTAGAGIYEAVEYDVIANAAQLQSSIENNAAATTLGSVTKKIEVFDAVGSSLGFVPLYDSIT